MQPVTRHFYQGRKTCLLLLTLVVTGLFAAYPQAVKAQDAQFSQFYALPTLWNPAMAGGSQGLRAGMQFRDQWWKLPTTLLSYATAYDQYLPAINSGVGAYFQQNRIGPTRSQTLAAQYAYQLRLNRQYGARFGLSGGAIHRSINFSNLIFSDQATLSGLNNPTAEPLTAGQPSRWMPTFGAGGVLYSRQLWVGLSAQHLNRPNQAINGGSSRLPMRWVVSGGYKFFKKSVGGHRQEDQYLTPTFLFKHQGPFDQLDLGLYGRYKALTAGFWYRGLPLKSSEGGAFNQDALVAMVGLHTPYLAIGYSYDLTISPLFGQALGSHEISLVVQWDPAKSQRHGTPGGGLPCPKF